MVGGGRGGGSPRFLPAEDRHYQTRSQFEASITSALGGYVAETVVFGGMSTGASNDLERASALARRRVTDYGMRERLGGRTPVSTPPRPFRRSGSAGRGYAGP